MGIGGVSGLTLQLPESLTPLQKNQHEATGSGTDVTSSLLSTLQTDYVNISSEGYDRSQNMLSSNFAGGSSRDSSYVDAQLTALSTQQSLKNSLNDSLDSSFQSTLDEAAFWYADPRMRQAKMMKDATESNAAVFSDMKNDIEEKADAAMAPKDENGNPIEQTGTAAATETGSAAPTPPSGEAGGTESGGQEGAVAGAAVSVDGVAQAAKLLSSISIKV